MLLPLSNLIKTRFLISIPLLGCAAVTSRDNNISNDKILSGSMILFGCTPVIQLYVTQTIEIQDNTDVATLDERAGKNNNNRDWELRYINMLISQTVLLTNRAWPHTDIQFGIWNIYEHNTNMQDNVENVLVHF
jgi:hypothetical protein